MEPFNLFVKLQYLMSPSFLDVKVPKVEKAVVVLVPTVFKAVPVFMYLQNTTNKNRFTTKHSLLSNICNIYHK